LDVDVLADEVERALGDGKLLCFQCLSVKFGRFLQHPGGIDSGLVSQLFSNARAELGNTFFDLSILNKRDAATSAEFPTAEYPAFLYATDAASPFASSCAKRSWRAFFRGPGISAFYLFAEVRL
jgi:hypothetical protein